MRYYDEETVKKLLTGEGPRELKFCPCIELPEEYGDLIDKEDVENFLIDEYGNRKNDWFVINKLAPVILKANRKIDY